MGEVAHRVPPCCEDVLGEARDLHAILVEVDVPSGGGGIGWVEDPPALALAAGRSLHYFLSPGTHRRLMSILIVDKPPWLLWSQEETEEGGSAKRPDGWGSRGTGVRGVCVRSKKGCDRGCLGPRCEGGCLGPRCEAV